MCVFRKIFGKQGRIGKEKSGNTEGITKESGEEALTEKKCTDYTGQGRWINRVSRFWHSNTLALTALFRQRCLCGRWRTGRALCRDAASCTTGCCGCTSLPIPTARRTSSSSCGCGTGCCKRRSSWDWEKTARAAAAGRTDTAAARQLEQAAQQEVWRSGSDQKVKAYLTRMYFDTREYEDFTMPAGVYRTVRFTIGKGEGHNWWCVLFPADVHPDSSAACGGRISDEQLKVLERRPRMSRNLPCWSCFTA